MTGRPVRLHFIMKDADLYSMRFGAGREFPPASELPVRKGLPDPLVMRDGSQVSSAEDWREICYLVAEASDVLVTARAVCEMAGIEKVDDVEEFHDALASAPAKKIPEILKRLREGAAQREKEAASA